MNIHSSKITQIHVNLAYFLRKSSELGSFLCPSTGFESIKVDFESDFATCGLCGCTSHVNHEDFTFVDGGPGK